jgi:hypothetical protein
MKIFSPIGDVPFTPNKLRIKNGCLILEGSMGAWPTKIQFDISDLPAVFKLVRYQILAFALVLVMILVILIIIR